MVQARLAHKGLLLVSLPLIWGTLCILLLFFLVQKAERENDEQVNAGLVLDNLIHLNRCISQAEMFSFQLEADLSKHSKIANVGELEGQLDQSISSLKQATQSLRASLKKASTEADTVDIESVISNRLIQLLRDTKELLRSADEELMTAKSQNIEGEMHNLVEESASKLDALISEENERLLQYHLAGEKFSALVKYGLISFFISELVICFLVGWFFAKSIVKRVSILISNAVRFGNSQALLVPIAGTDEIAEFDQLFHSVAENLTEARRKEFLMVEKSADVIFNVDETGIVRRVNDACQSAWGRTSLEVLNKPLLELVHSEDRALVQETMDLKTNATIDCRIAEEYVCKISFSWAEQTFFCIAHDIATRKLMEAALIASERHLRNTLNSMVVAVVVTSLEGIVESVNHSAEQIFGCSESELVGRHCLCLFGDAKFFSDTAQKDVEVFQKSLHQQFLNRVAETECKRQDGRIFAAELSMNKMEMADGERYILGILDVSNLRDAERSRKEFVSTVSHELRTPLTSIRGSLTLLTAGAMGALPDPIRKQIVVAERNVLRLIGLINDILDIEKLESGKLDMVFEDVNMASILERSFEAVKSFAEQHQVNLDIQPSDVVINADGDRLIQVLVNLMSNACKFSPKGETVTITVSQEDEWLSVKVIDRGRGIPEKFKKLLFQRFQQVEAADAKKKGGTGLGLAICKGLIEAHGGTIGVDSEEGEGSTFWFRVPQNQGQKSVHLLN